VAVSLQEQESTVAQLCLCLPCHGRLVAVQEAVRVHQPRTGDDVAEAAPLVDGETRPAESLSLLRHDTQCFYDKLLLLTHTVKYRSDGDGGVHSRLTVVP
jgi:hypothetical protein